MRRSISAALALACACGGFPQAFGRFGYNDPNLVIGFEVDRGGFRVRHARADRVRFETPSEMWKPLRTTDIEQTVGLTGLRRSPSKLRSNLHGLGFELYFRAGFALRIDSLSAPFVTWNEGSVGEGVPTPETDWVLISFRDAQPPIALGFEGSTCAVKVTGRSGQWQIASVKPREGWVRVIAPIGSTPFPTTSAADLGALSTRIRPVIPWFSRPSPQLKDLIVQEDAQGVVATWRFDAPGALLPAPFALAPLGGYPLKLQSETRRLPGFNEYGPVVVAASDSVTARFPVRRVPTGRSVVIGEPTSRGPATASALDIPSVVELALQNLFCFRDGATKNAGKECFQEFLTEATYESEPATGQRLPFGKEGKGLDLAAAHALLIQAATIGESATSEPNSLLTSLVWRRDSYTWRLWCPNAVIRRRAAALAAIAGALCPEPERRLDGAMFQAGLAAELGYDEWLKLQQAKATPERGIETMTSLRAAIFAGTGRTQDGDRLLAALQSEIRIYGDISVVASAVDGAIQLAWTTQDTSPRTIILASGYPLEVEAGLNVALQDASEALGFTVVRVQPSAPGTCVVRLRLPAFAAPLPVAPSKIAYEESGPAP